ncbi:hypothetical protein ACFL50_05895 [Candidatus Latescibacterota bacterium]
MAKICYIYFLTDKNLIVSDRIDKDLIPKKKQKIKDYFGKEYLVTQIIPSSENDRTVHVLIKSIDD